MVLKMLMISSPISHRHLIKSNESGQMKVKQFRSHFIIRLEKDEELIQALEQFVRKYKIQGGFFFGLGVAKNLSLGYFDAHKKSYIKRRFKGEYEFTSLVGNISHLGKQVIIHAHATITDSRFKAYGGHIFKAYIPATCELFVWPVDKIVQRQKDPTTGLNLLKL